MTQEKQEIPAIHPDPLKVVLNIIRNRKSEHDFTITFTIKDEFQSTFRDVFTGFLNELPKPVKFVIKTADDSETKKPMRMFIDVESYGAQQQIANRLQQFALILKPYCLEIK